MSAKGYATPLRFEVGADRLLQRLYLGMLLLTVGSLGFLAFSLTTKFLLLLLLLVVARLTWYRRAELGGRPVQLLWDGEQRWWWTQGGVEQEVELLGESYLGSRLAVLNFRPVASRRRRALVLTAATIGSDTFRQLQVRFRISPQAPSEGHSA